MQVGRAELVPVRVHDHPPERAAVHRRRGDQARQHAAVVPPVGRLDLLRRHEHARVGSKGLGDLEVGHQAGVEADEFDAPGRLRDRSERRREFVDRQRVGITRLGDRDPGPGHAVIAEQHGVALGRIRLGRRVEEARERALVAHVGVAPVRELDELARLDAQQFCGVPVAHAGHRRVRVEALALRAARREHDDLHGRGTADGRHLGEVAHHRLLEVVVGVEIDEQGPFSDRSRRVLGERLRNPDDAAEQHHDRAQDQSVRHSGSSRQMWSESTLPRRRWGIRPAPAYAGARDAESSAGPGTPAGPAAGLRSSRPV